MTNFWLWLCRFAYGRIRDTTAYSDMPDGVPSIRSVESPCPVYAPRRWRIGDFRDCQTDSHYLCRECAHRALTHPEGGSRTAGPSHRI